MNEIEAAARALAIQLAPIYRDMIPLEQAVEFAEPVILVALAHAARGEGEACRLCGGPHVGRAHVTPPATSEAGARRAR